MPQIDNSQYIAVSGTLSAAVQSIAVDLSSVPFVPDAMVIKEISFAPENTTTSFVNVIKCDLSNSILGIFSCDAVVLNPVNINTEHEILLKNLSIHGLHTFTISNPINSALHADGSFGMLIEFVKYKSKKY